MGIKRKLGIAGLVIVALFVLLVAIAGVMSTVQDEEQERLQSPEISRDEAKENALHLEYDTLLRFNEEYVGDIVYYKGEVVQMVHRYGDTYLLFITPDTGEWLNSDRLAVHYSGQRILEDDVVEVYGVVAGLYEYEAVFGNQVIVPEIDALYLERIVP